MKSIFLMIGLLMASLAQAGTTTLEQTGPCGPAYYCTNVVNSANEVVTAIVYSPGYGRLSVLIGGSLQGGYTLWDSGAYALPVVYGANPPSVTLTSVPLYDGLGHVMYATVDFVGGNPVGKCHQVGRVCVPNLAPLYITGGSLSQ